MEADLVTNDPRPATERALGLASRLGTALDDYRQRHPDLRPEDVEQALRLVVRPQEAAETKADPERLASQEQQERRMSWMMAGLLILFTVAMFAALLLIRRP